MSNIVGIAATLGDRLRAERKRLGLNQSDMGKKGGVSRNSQVAYESGKTPFTGEYLSALAEVGLDPAFVLTGSRSTLALSDSAAELLDLFDRMPIDLQHSLLVVARSLGGGGSPPTIHDDRQAFGLRPAEEA